MQSRIAAMHIGIPYVSIIVPVYNGELTIERCLQSVLKQSYSNWECIVINDGSIDNTSKIIQHFAETDKRIFEVIQLNSGVSAARNLGIDMAAGEWITFLDADDYLEIDYLEKLVLTQKQYQADLTMCEFTNFLPDKGRRDRRNILDSDCYAEGEEMFKVFFPRFLWNDKKQRPGGPVCKLYSKKIIQDNRIHFNIDVHYNEDFLFNLWYFQFISSLYYKHESLYNRRIHDISAVHRYQCDIYIEIEKMFINYQKLRSEFRWKCDLERMFFLHLLVDLPFNMYICRPENPLSFKEKEKEYFSFLKRPAIYEEWKKIRLSDCRGKKNKMKFIFVKEHQFFLLYTIYNKNKIMRYKIR